MIGRVGLLILVIMLAGCAGGADRPGGSGSGGSASTSPSPLPATPSVAPSDAGTPTLANRITLVRTGGFAGVHDELVVEPDGRWRFSKEGGAAETGHLTPEQLVRLRQLANGPALAREARVPHGEPACNDGFVYTLTVGHLTVRTDDCGQPDVQRPTLGEIVRLLADATPL